MRSRKFKSTKRNIEEEEETLEKEIALIKKKLVKEGKQICRTCLMGGDCYGEEKYRKIAKIPY